MALVISHEKPADTIAESCERGKEFECNMKQFHKDNAESMKFIKLYELSSALASLLH